MFNKNISEITKEDLEKFVNLRLEENLNLEYKSQLNIESGDSKKEFLEDVSAFANSNGGYIIFGIKEEKGIPAEIVGIEITDKDQYKLRLHNIIDSTIKPKIDYSLVILNIAESKFVIIIQIHESFIGPHGVLSNGHLKFNRRIDGGKMPMDINELKEAFLGNGTLVDKIRNYRIERLQKIKSNKTPVDFSGNNIIAIHIIPRLAFTGNTFVNGNLMARIKGDQNLWLKAVYSRNLGTMPEINFDGLYSWTEDYTRKSARCYVQIFRNGIVETAENLLLNRESIQDLEQAKLELPSLAIEEEIYKFISDSLKFYQGINIQPPFYVFISLLGVEGKTMASSRLHFHKKYIRENNLLLPEVIISDSDADVKKCMKSVIDMIWNASGIDSSIYFDKDGNWNPKIL